METKTAIDWCFEQIGLTKLQKHLKNSKFETSDFWFSVHNNYSYYKITMIKEDTTVVVEVSEKMNNFKAVIKVNNYVAFDTVYKPVTIDEIINTIKIFAKEE